MGEQGFVFEVLDELNPVDDPAYDYRDDLKALSFPGLMRKGWSR